MRLFLGWIKVHQLHAAEIIYRACGDCLEEEPREQLENSNAQRAWLPAQESREVKMRVLDFSSPHMTTYPSRRKDAGERDCRADLSKEILYFLRSQSLIVLFWELPLAAFGDHSVLEGPYVAGD